MLACIVFFLGVEGFGSLFILLYTFFGGFLGFFYSKKDEGDN